MAIKAAQIWVFSALAEVPTKVLTRSDCFKALKKALFSSVAGTPRPRWRRPASSGWSETPVPDPVLRRRTRCGGNSIPVRPVPAGKSQSPGRAANPCGAATPGLPPRCNQRCPSCEYKVHALLGQIRKPAVIGVSAINGQQRPRLVVQLSRHPHLVLFAFGDHRIAGQEAIVIQQ